VVHPYTQSLIALLLVAAAATYLATRLWQLVRRPASGACGGCTGCSASHERSQSAERWVLSAEALSKTVPRRSQNPPCEK